MHLRVLVVDDHEVVRMGVRKLIEGHPDWEVVAEAANGAEAVDKARELAPDVVILDILMPTMNGFETAAELRHIMPATKIILLSLHEVPISAREVGADAFVSKASVAQELLDAIERVTRSNGRAAANRQN